MPQGSVLGFVLFLTYVSEWQEDIKSNMDLFSDDALVVNDFICELVNGKISSQCSRGIA